MVEVKLNGVKNEMELDTGAAVSLVSQQVFQGFVNSEIELKPTTVKLRSYSGHELKVKGECNVVVECNGQNKSLSLLVVEGQGPSLFGRNWLSSFQLNWELIKHIQDDIKIETLISKYHEVFQEDLGTLKNVAAKIHVDPRAIPIFCRARPVPYSLRHKVEEELDRLEKEGIIQSIQFSEWASPIVPVMKSNGSLRMCGDYKSTVNKVSKLDSYPLPRTEDILTNLSGGKSFTK